MSRPRKRKGKGFSQPGSRQGFDILFGLTGIKGREKRHVLNSFSIYLAIIVAAMAGVMGFVWFGFWGAFFGACLGWGLMCKLLQDGGFYR